MRAVNRKYADLADGVPRGFRTPTRRIEKLHPETEGQGHRRRRLGPARDTSRRHRVRARFNASLDPQVVCGQHGWWQACDDLGLPSYPPFGPGSANLNLVLRQGPSDPLSGSAPLRASVCEVTPA